MIIAVVLSVCLLCMMCFVSALLIVKTLGRAGNAVLSRVLGMLLAAYRAMRDQRDCGHPDQPAKGLRQSVNSSILPSIS
ncbi:hypothetical protein [Bradyrhizobium sp. MOS003]|uniref:hypothetical protein n=1 Tax=Bradyrhizobium sp. MOS003 TaxID=2133946 RepID=UPI001FE01AFA|nr:hypothetical protein [Bradyrhizobium sp. MOS003]